MNPEETRFHGTCASRGIALGRVVRDCGPSSVERTIGNQSAEAETLRLAVRQSLAELADLASGLDEMAAEILEVQMAFLEDEELIDPVLERIADGEAADAAWHAIMDEQVRDYEQSDNDYFRARATDLGDLRDRVLRAMAPASKPGSNEPAGGGLFFIGDELTPSRFLEIDWKRYTGAALSGGSVASHVSMLARARGVPLVVGLDAELASIEDGAEAILDARDGDLILNPSATTRDKYAGIAEEAARVAAEEARYLGKPAVTANGKSVTVYVNIDDPSIVEAIDPAHCDGIGLARTEFLFQGGQSLPDEESQYAAYAKLVRWAAGKPVTLRTLDAGGDKPITGLTPEGETNPFLGLRGLRLSLTRPDVFRIQLRAIARAAALGPVKAMCPMVTAPDEMIRARDLLRSVIAELKAEGADFGEPQLGMMVEVPAAALNAADFEADFYSIGSNDLIQYVTASARDTASVSALHDATNPAVLELIGRTVAAGIETGREVSLCGEMASDPDLLGVLLGLGLDAVSVAPASLARCKAALARWHG
ncbi:MAG: phosphoenolpyruvate--protein phosphotransferase [Rhodospirillales bacterium]|nr:phosphoenolpyruvate--protein phosphotransferase [Rhodospirillales bacterium]